MMGKPLAETVDVDPNWRASFRPQHQTVSARTAQVCCFPAARSFSAPAGRSSTKVGEGRRAPAPSTVSIPNSPFTLRPQHQTCGGVCVRPQECSSPRARPTNPPAGASGTLVGVSSCAAPAPFRPSCSSLFAPQHKVPCEERAHACAAPSDTCSIAVAADTDIAVGCGWPEVPRPSCPASFAPAQMSAPVVRSEHVKWPAATRSRWHEQTPATHSKVSAQPCVPQHAWPRPPQLPSRTHTVSIHVKPGLQVPSAVHNLPVGSTETVHAAVKCATNHATMKLSCRSVTGRVYATRGRITSERPVLLFAADR